MTATTQKREPYVIQRKVWPERYARGWHVLGKADRFTEEPQTLDYFGTRLAAYRGKEDGQVHVLDSYCPHMGADLSKGHVEGNSLVCPFHAWSWGSDGVCDHIPYAKRIPPRAVIKSWPTLERNGLLLVWNDPEGGEPDLSVAPKIMDDYYSGEWTDWVMARFLIKSHCRELVDNMADMAHFGPVHYSTVRSFRNVQDGHTFTQYMVGGHEILTEGEHPMTSVAHYEGPAYMTTTMTGMMDGVPMTTHLLVSHVPISTEAFHINLGVMMKKNPDFSEEENRAAVEAYTARTIESFEQDVEIWDNKVLIDNPLLCDGDGPINMVRKWYGQFYADVADIDPHAVARKEHITMDGPTVEEVLAAMHADAARTA